MEGQCDEIIKHLVLENAACLKDSVLTESLLVGGAVRKQKVSAKLPSFRRLLELDKLGVSCFEQVLVKCGAISLKDSRQVNETLHADF